MRRLRKIFFQSVLYVSVISLCSSFFIPVETVQIRIFTQIKVNSLAIQQVKGNYKILADGALLRAFFGAEPVEFALADDSVEIRVNGKPCGRAKYIKLITEEEGELRIRLLDPDRKARVYQDLVSISVSEGALKIINDIRLDPYIAGVTEAEAGSRTYLEFYKVQAILARTFALAHINKHITEGFSLCDQVHCQAYYGKPRDPAITKAVLETRGKVVVDENLNLIVAAFHSNSGGQTANSEDVWGSRTPYLRSINDTFSTRMPNSKWERRMLADDWLSYLKVKHNFPVENEEVRNLALNFTQSSRKTFLEANNARVPLKNVRTDFQLKSTFFSIRPLSSDSVLFTGRGYGHGLGMCQEGAMCMAKLGYRYMDILNFYYRNIQLIDLHKLNFYKDE